MDYGDIPGDAAQILSPLSGLSVDQVVEKYSNNKDLSTSILQEPLDFKNSFLAENERFLQVGSTRLRTCHNIQHQHGGGPIYLFFHGLGGNLTQFEPLLRLLGELNEGFVAVDLPGFGLSDEQDSYQMLQVTQVVRDAFLKITSHKKVILVGHSMGCHLALHFATLFGMDFDIKDSVFLSPPAPVLPQLQKVSTRLALSVLCRLPFLFDWYRSYFDQSKGLQSSGIKQFFYKGDDYRKLWQFHYNVQIKSRSLVAYLRGWVPVDWSKVSLIPSAVVITGENDPVTPLDNAKTFYHALEEHIHHTKFITIEDCSHNICFDQPQRLTKQFLDEVINRHG
ncbi:LAQU0S16e01948g1_1 [Lachancea quebecensis]|uniref:LAQU0S16e01948g1_1 n=1 Tax=Lachancea quebecensis TaxID=1654605 RepID=A0A0P1KYJ4_9SACH|nr:LAQU0S16e01948g1_1 [Lachancea quebecensis]